MSLSNHSAGMNFVLLQISGRFWIVAAREEIRAWEKECSESKRRRKKPPTQIMGPLPQGCASHFVHLTRVQRTMQVRSPLYKDVGVNG